MAEQRIKLSPESGLERQTRRAESEQSVDEFLSSPLLVSATIAEKAGRRRVDRSCCLQAQSDMSTSRRERRITSSPEILYSERF